MHKITVEITVNAQVELVWGFWTEPERIVHWAFASDDWHAPYVENDFRVQGKFKIVMEAKDKSAGFNFTGKYTNIKEYKIIEYVMEDERKVSVQFEDLGDKTKIIETFDPERENPVEMQKSGWQAILNNFKKYTEGQIE